MLSSKIYKFFHEITKPFDPDQSATPPKPNEIQNLLRAAARYGYWLGSPQENAAIGLSLGSPTSKSLSTAGIEQSIAELTVRPSSTRLKQEGEQS